MTERTTHRHGWHPFDGAKADRPAKDVKCTPIDIHVCLRPFVHGHDAEGEPVKDHPAGFIVAHDADDLPQRCEGAITTDPHLREGQWTQTGSLKAGDLTLAPSVLCKRDGFHGFVQGGAWVPA